MSNICLWLAVAEVATTSTARRRATNTTNSYKNCELFTGIVVVVVLAYFALDSPSRFSFPFPLSLSLPLSLLLCTSVSATARHWQRQRQWNRQTAGNGDASSAVSVSFVVSVGVGASVVRASRRIGQVVCFLYFANIKSIFLAGIICRLTQPQAQRQRQRQASHELNLLEPAQILTKQMSLAAARCMNYLGSCNLPFARAKCALPPLTPCQHYPPLQLALKLYSLTAVVFSSRSVRFCLLFRKLIIFEDEAASSPSQHLPAPSHSVFFSPFLAQPIGFYYLFYN